MGFFDRFKNSRNDSDDDLDMNRTRIENNREALDDLREKHDQVPHWDHEYRNHLDKEIKDRENRIDHLHERRDEIHESNYDSDENSDD